MSQHPVVICGKDVVLTIASNSYSGHSCSVAQTGREIDVTSFGSSPYGDYKVCIIDGVITAQTYQIPSIQPDDVVSISFTAGGTSLTYSNCKSIGYTIEADAKGGVVGCTSTFRITEASS